MSRASTNRRRLCALVAVVGFVGCATYEPPPVRDDTRGGSGAGAIGGTEPGGGSPATAGMSAQAGGGSGGAFGGSSAGTAGNAPEPRAGASATAGTAGGGDEAGGGGGPASGGGAGGEGGEGGSGVVDECPTDPLKTTPGVCGCGLPDTDTAAEASCAGLKAALVHRYDFEGTGTTITDRVGSAHGVIVGDAALSKLDGKGVVTLSGGTAGPYVDLPNKLVSSLTNATLEAWVTWGGGANWQRVFDFGDSSSTTPEDNPATGKTYLFLTPKTDAGSGGTMRAVYSLAGGAAANETRLEAATALPQALTHVALVVDTSADQLVLYVDGVNAGEKAFTGALSSINDVNAWLGRSQFNADPEFTGTFHEFRIYSAALDQKQIATSFASGPDPAFLSE